MLLFLREEVYRLERQAGQGTEAAWVERVSK